MKKASLSLDPGRTLTLRAGSTAYVDHLRLEGRAPATLEAQENALRQFGKFWGDRDLREATPEDLELYAGEIIGRISRETAYLYLGSLRAFFRFLADRQVLLLDPAAGLPMPRMANRLAGPTLTREEMKRLVESPQSESPIGLRDRALLEFLYSTGLRAAEARAVKAAPRLRARPCGRRRTRGS